MREKKPTQIREALLVLEQLQEQAHQAEVSHV